MSGALAGCRIVGETLTLGCGFVSDRQQSDRRLIGIAISSFVYLLTHLFIQNAISLSIHLSLVDHNTPSISLSPPRLLFSFLVLRRVSFFFPVLYLSFAVLRRVLVIDADLFERALFE